MEEECGRYQGVCLQRFRVLCTDTSGRDGGNLIHMLPDTVAKALQARVSVDRAVTMGEIQDFAPREKGGLRCWGVCDLPTSPRTVLSNVIAMCVAILGM